MSDEVKGLYLPTGEMVRRRPEPPAGVLEELRAIHPLLGLRYLPFHRQWWRTWQWDENDPRRRRVQLQAVTPGDAHTLVGPLPADCSPQEAAAFARRELVINPPAKMWERVAERIERDNVDAEQAVMDAALADVHNRIELSAKSLKSHFVENVEATDIKCDYDVEAPSADELRAAVTGSAL